MKERAFINQLREMLNIHSPSLPSKRPLFIYSSVCPGGGKTRMTGVLAEAFPNLKVGVIVPRVSLMRQTARSMKDHFGVDLRQICGNKESTDPCRGGRGWITTFNTINNDPDTWMAELARNQYVLDFDEGHHMKVSLAGEMNDFARACEPLMRMCRVLSIKSGTLITSDNSKLLGPAMPDREGYPWPPHGYAKTGSRWALDTAGAPEWCDIFVKYSRKDALREKAIVPLVFHSIDGEVKFSKDGQVGGGQLSVMEDDDRYAALYTALETGMAFDLIDSGVGHWLEHGGNGKLLVIAHDQKAARKYVKYLLGFGIGSVELAISEEDGATDSIKRFQEGASRVLVSVAMAYEGLDVPAISHVIFLTRIRSRGWVEQAFGRAWRTLKGKHRGHVFAPDDVLMNAVIASIQADQEQVLMERPGEGGGGGVPPDGIDPMESAANGISAGHLDGDVTAQVVADELREALKGRFSEDGIDEMVSAYMRKHSASSLASKKEKTVTEREEDIRKQITAIVRQWCIVNKEKFGVHFGELKGINGGKKIGELSVKQLEGVLDYVKAKYKAA